MDAKGTGQSCIDEILMKFTKYACALSVFLGLGTIATAATYDCSVSKVVRDHAYLPSSIQLKTDAHFLEVAVTNVAMENVQTKDVEGEVVLRNASRIRIMWSMAEYIRTGRVKQIKEAYYGAEPINFLPTLSLDLKSMAFIMEVVEKNLRHSQGEGRGTCRKTP